LRWISCKPSGCRQSAPQLWRRCSKTRSPRVLMQVFFPPSSLFRSVRQSVSPARRTEDQQEEDFHQTGRHESHLQRGHDLLRAVHRRAGLWRPGVPKQGMMGCHFIDSIQLNSVYFIKPIVTNNKLASEGFTICTHMTSLTFDLTSDQGKTPTKKLSRGKKGRTLQESNRGGSLSRMDRTIDVM